MSPRANADLTGQVAIVTGAAGELGRVIARDLVEAGAQVAWVGRHESTLRKAVGALADGGERTMVVRADVRNERSVRGMVEKVAKRFGQIDILVNNAALRGPTAPIPELRTKDWNEVIATNLTGPFLVARECLKLMAPRRRGRIINMSSMAGRMAYPLRASYASSKWGLIGLTLTLAQEAGSSNIPVNAICPGPVEGDVMKEVITHRAKALGVSFEKMREQFIRPAALGRMVSPTDVSRMILFLCSDAGRNITGQVIEVHAGFGLWPG